MNIEDALIIVKKVVKESHIKNQRHVDLSLCTADQRANTQEALMYLQAEVAKGSMTDAELKEKLGL